MPLLLKNRVEVAVDGFSDRIIFFFDLYSPKANQML
jgi:hypothetical protein